ncbi:hypothetical protein Psesu_2618 [Pseudoxanthomonas suwonensis 11-1]|uniref:Protein sip-5 n=1 Tax=Pseudoxanthomonas suwonensis (strain 11-1) TaxID=743721 RepID=E6WWH2_PSEUU|nr:hypothetical protein [Pseudoxanthomonas suwonensis]ADV28449.1 hypothetical protein Psesu_2618 [Pseudoxanthomonas suwonensis 11-1]
MRFETLRQRVERTEARVQRCMDRAESSRTELRQMWKLGWTPPRIIIAGAVAGFLVGRAEPLSKVGGTRWLQLIGTASSMIASIRAAAASETAEDAAQTAAASETAEDAAQTAAAEAAVAGTEAQAAPTYGHAAAPGRVPTGTAPAPAEAATEISER